MHPHSTTIANLFSMLKHGLAEFGLEDDLLEVKVSQRLEEILKSQIPQPKEMGRPDYLPSPFGDIPFKTITSDTKHTPVEPHRDEPVVTAPVKPDFVNPPVPDKTPAQKAEELAAELERQRATKAKPVTKPVAQPNESEPII